MTSNNEPYAHIYKKMDETGLNFQAVLSKYPEYREGFEDCGGVWRNMKQEKADYQKRCDAIAQACEGIRQNEISRIKAMYEMEPDEFYTAEEKAVGFIETGNFIAPCR